MKFQDVIGIDVGKLKNESIIHSSQLTLEFDNNNAGFKKLISWVEKHSTCPIKRIIFAFEHTGIYSFPLSVYLTENEFSYVVIPGLEIKRSMGIARGKDDKVDAKRIALYTYRSIKKELKEKQKNLMFIFFVCPKKTNQKKRHFFKDIFSVLPQNQIYFSEFCYSKYRIEK